MTVMGDAERREAWAEIMSEWSLVLKGCPITKTDLRAAFDAVDNWIHLNQTSYNTAIPQPARSALTTSQKAELLLFVVRKRFLAGV